jgi:hypothetical protein
MNRWGKRDSNPQYKTTPFLHPSSFQMQSKELPDFGVVATVFTISPIYSLNQIQRAVDGKV